jgi:hypothetical protein
MLQVTIIDQGQRFAVLNTVKQNQTAKPTRPHTVLLLGDGALVFLLIDNVRLHANREIAGHRSAFHGAPLINFVGIFSRDLNVDARPAYRFLAG